MKTPYEQFHQFIDPLSQFDQDLACRELLVWCLPFVDAERFKREIDSMRPHFKPKDCDGEVT